MCLISHMLRKLLLWFLLTLCLVELIIFLSIYYNTECEYGDKIDLKNTSCSHSENLGTKLYFHICEKENSKVYDLRYFWKEELDRIKPQIIGVQLSERQFKTICQQCYN